MNTDKLKDYVDDRITFLFDHWTMEDKRPYTFGGWREEVVNDIVQKISRQAEIETAEKFKEECYLEDDESADTLFNFANQIIKGE